MKTITASASFTDEQIKEFAVFKGWDEFIIENEEIIQNKETAEMYISKYVIGLLTDDIAYMNIQKSNYAIDIEKQKQENFIKKSIEESLSVTVE